MKKFNLTLNIILLLAILFLLYTPFYKLGLFPNLLSLFRSQSFEIADTPVIVQQIKNIAQLFTQSYYDECYFDTGSISTPLLQRNKQLVLIANGKVIAGFDLANFSEKSLHRQGNRITITLPPPKILDVVITPTGFETFIEKGDISFEERTHFQDEARKKLEQNAIAKGILKYSGEQGKQILDKFFRLLGFEKVDIQIQG